MNSDKSYQKMIAWALDTAAGHNNSVNFAHPEKYAQEIQDIRVKILEGNPSVEECVALWTNLEERARNAILVGLKSDHSGPRLSEGSLPLRELANAIRFYLSSKGNSITAELIHQFGNAGERGQVSFLILIVLSEEGDPNSKRFFDDLSSSSVLPALQSTREWEAKLVEASNRKQKRVEDQIPYEEEIDILLQAESTVQKFKRTFEDNLLASRQKLGSNAI